MQDNAQQTPVVDPTATTTPTMPAADVTMTPVPAADVNTAVVTETPAPEVGAVTETAVPAMGAVVDTTTPVQNVGPSPVEVPAEVNVELPVVPAPATPVATETPATPTV